MATSLAMVAIASFLDTNDDMTCARHFIVNVIVLPGPYPMSFNKDSGWVEQASALDK